MIKAVADGASDIFIVAGGCLSYKVDGEIRPMDETNKGVLHDGLNLGGSCTLSRLDEIGAEIRLRARLTNLANEDMNSAEGDPVPVLN